MQAEAKDKILEELGRVLGSAAFRRAPRLQQFLSHVVHIKVNGDPSSLKESTIGVEVFDREFGYDPKVEPVVRVQARRLREKLREYYGTDGKDAPWRIELPRGTYVPEFQQSSRPETPAAEEKTTRRGIGWAWVSGLVALTLLVLAAGIRWLPSQTRTLTITPWSTWAGLQYMPTVNPQGDRMAFVWQQPGAKAQIYLVAMGASNAEPQRLNDIEAEQWRPAWRPDGGALAFLQKSEGGFDVMVRDLRTGRDTRICTTRVYFVLDPAAPGLDWTPDSKYLLTVEQNQADRPSYLTRIEVATGKKTPISNPPSASSGDIDVKVSPDGKHIAFQRGQLGELWTARLTEGGAEGERRVATGSRGLRGFAWLDAEELIFAYRTSVNEKTLGKARLNGSVEEVSLDGQRLVDVSYSRARREMYGAHVASDTNLWWVSRRDGNWRQAVATTRNEWHGAVGPKTGAIAYVSERSGSPEIWVAQESGSRARQLTRFGKEIYLSWPEWDDSEERIVFHGRSEGNSDLYMAWTQDGRVERLTNEYSRELGATFADGGKTLLFTSDRGGSFGVWKLELATRMVSAVHAGSAILCRAWGDAGEIVCSRFGSGVEIFAVKQGVERCLAKGLPSAALTGWDLDEEAVYFPDAAGSLQRTEIRNGTRTRIAEWRDAPAGSLASLHLSRDRSQFLVTRQDLFQSKIARVRF
jgi:dipeptidyl aminopeptidase/acylaminoacyl peptidase